jgi:hypothetical protein
MDYHDEASFVQARPATSIGIVRTGGRGSAGAIDEVWRLAK